MFQTKDELKEYLELKLSLGLSFKIHVYNNESKYLLEDECCCRYYMQDGCVRKLDPIIRPKGYLTTNFEVSWTGKLRIKDIMKYIKENRIYARHCSIMSE